MTKKNLRKSASALHVNVTSVWYGYIQEKFASVFGGRLELMLLEAASKPGSGFLLIKFLLFCKRFRSVKSAHGVQT